MNEGLIRQVSSRSMPMPGKRNKYDQRDCLEMGEKAEDVFARIAAQKGWKVTTASNYANINDHWDFLIQKVAELSIQQKMPDTRFIAGQDGRTE